MNATVYAQVLARLTAQQLVLLDAGTGTELERLGAQMHDKAWCAMANASAPDIVREVHSNYIRAGAKIITTNTFSTNRNMLEPAGLGERFSELNANAVRLALEARELSDAGNCVLVAGSMSHQGPVMGRGDRRNPEALPSVALASERFEEMAQTLAAGGVDFILMEMMSDPAFANPAIAAARRTGLPVWVGFSVRADDDHKPVSHSLPGCSAEAMIAAVDLSGVDVVGIMHSPSHVTAAAIDALATHWEGPISVYPDSGYFKMPNWQFENIIEPTDFAAHCRSWYNQGARAIGGCCGLGHEHIVALAREFQAELRA